MAFNNTFVFTGTLKFPKEDSKRPFHTLIHKNVEKELPLAQKTWEGHKLNFFMEVGKNNGQFAEIFGGWTFATKDFKSWSKGSGAEKGSELIIPVNKRNDKEILDMVADFKKFKVNLGEEKVFITDYDFAKELAETLKSVGDRMVTIKGDFKMEESKGVFYKKFNPTSIVLAEEGAKPKFTLTADIFFDEGSLSETRLEETGLIDVIGYIEQYEGKNVPDKFYPMSFVIDTGKLDMENAEHLAKLNYLKRQFDVTETFHHLTWDINVFRGSDKVEFTEDMLTDSQKEQVMLGYAKVKDFERGFNGETVELYKLTKPVLSGAFKDGAVDSGLEVEDVISRVKGSSVEVAKTSTPLTKPAVEEEDDDLFS